MKFIFAVLATALSLNLWATSTGTHIFDLQYLPEKRVSFGITEFYYVNTQYRQSSYSSHTDTGAISQTLGHSFANRFSMYLSGAYSQEHARDRFRIAGINSNTHLTSKGVSDPVINFKYRLQDDYFRFDVLAGLLIKSGANEAQNNKLGSNRLNLGFNFGQKYELVQWMVLMSYYRQMADGARAAYNYYKVDAAGLWYVGEYSLIKLLGTAYVSDLVGGGVYRNSTITNLVVGPEYQYLFTENFLARTGIAYSTLQVTNRNAKIDDGWIYSVGLNYQF